MSRPQKYHLKSERQTEDTVVSPAMGHRGTCPPRLPAISFLVHFGVNLTANYCVVCEISWCSTADVNNSHSIISHKTISHRAAAEPGPEVRRECTVTYFPALSLLATNPGDATVKTDCRVRGRQILTDDVHFA